MIFNRVHLILIVSIFFFRTLCALDPKLAVTQYVIDTWTVDDGLPQNTISCIIQTHDGYLWVGTGNGIARFDGIKFTVFNTFNSRLRGRDIKHFFEDKDKNLWIVSKKGLSCFKQGKFVNFKGQEESVDRRIGQIWDGNRNDVWIGTFKGILRYKNGKFETFMDTEIINGYRFNSFIKDNQNNLWLGTARGLLRFNNGRFGKLIGSGEDRKYFFREIFQDSQGNLWIGTINGLRQYRRGQINGVKGTERLLINAIIEDRWGNLWIGAESGLKQFRNGRIETIDIKNKLTESYIERIVEDKDGNLWIGTVEGLYRCWKGLFASIKKENGLADNHVIYIYQDREGNLWIGTKRGLSRLKNPRILTYSMEEGLGCDFPRSIYQDKQGRIWISGDCEGITSLAKGKFKVYSEQTGFPGLGGGGFFEDSRGFLWCGDKLTTFKNETFQVFKTSGSDTIRSFNAVQEDGMGNLWIGTEDGLICLKDNKLITFTTDDGLSDNLVQNIFFAKDKTLWIATNRGCTLFKDGTFHTIRKGKELSQKAVLDIYQDEEETIWLGTYGGLYRYLDGNFFLYTSQDGLVDDAILGMLEDENKNLWMSSNHGIFYVNKKELHDFAEGRIHSLHPVSFDRNDGMKSEECNSGRQPSCLKSRDGRLWFPTMKGVVVVDSNRLKLNTRPPPVHIEDVLLDGEQVMTRGKIKVMPGIKRIEFHYTAINFQNSKKVRFRYMLERHDKQWIENGPGKERIALYMNIPGGEYTFRVIACTNDGFWGKQGASIALKIVPPFHQTWWFKSFGLIIFAIAFYLLVSFIKKYFSLFAFWKEKSHIGQYVIVKLIGCGGIAEVFKAHHLLKKKKIVAIKILKREYSSRELSKKRFKQEGAIMDRLDHPNIIKIFERGQQEENYYIVMEYLEGQTLAERIKDESRIKNSDFIEIMRQLSGALAVLHCHNIMHRDLKPANIMLVEREGTRNFVKLLDFGLARSLYQTRMTKSGSLLGTIHYIPPEQIIHSVFSPAGDIYALGMIGYEMLTGVMPFTGNTDMDIIQMKLNKEPVAPIVTRSDIPLAFSKLIMQMIDRNFKARPTADKILYELETFN